MTALDSLLHRLSSLKITVTLLALSIFLVFAGTIAQTTQGIWPVVDGYFRSLYVWIDIAIFVPGGYEAPSASFPYPGGWLLGGLLLTNLLAAQVTRFHYTWKRSGILLSHLGLLALMLSELVTGLVAQEAQFVFVKGQTAHYAEDIREFELALIDTSQPDRDDVWVVPESRLKPGRTLTDPILPFHIEILSVYPNSRVDQNTPSGDLPYTIEPATESTGASGEPTVDFATARIRLIDPATGKASDDLLVSQWFRLPQPAQFGDRTLRLDLRHKRIFKPYTVTLLDLEHENYIGTNRPKNFQSHVRVNDHQTDDQFEALIYMNHPLRYRGDTLYQHQMEIANGQSVLQVVSNPGWLIPYISCTMITVGLTVHFFLSLTRFSRRQAKR